MSIKNQDLHVKPQSIQFGRRVNNDKNTQKSLDSDVQEFAAAMLANIYDNCAEILDEYNKNRGIADAGTYIEGARKVIDWATFGTVKSTSHIRDNLQKKSLELKNLDFRDVKSFKDKFKEFTGIEYNEENIKKLMTLVYEQGVDFESEEFKEACDLAFGLKGLEKQQKYVKRSSTVDGLGDIAIMLISMGAVSKTKLMGKLTTSLYKALGKGAGKFLSKVKADKAAKLGTSMLMGGASLAGFTLTKETLDNITNPMREAGKVSTWKQTGIASLESFGFGAFGGLLNETVVGPLVKYLAKPGKQVTQAVGRVLSENAEVSGKEIMQTTLRAQNLNLNGLFKMNSAELKSYAQVLGAHAAGFGVEVVGFAGYEAGLDAIKDICDPETGRLPEDMTLENLTKYLGHKIGEQFSNLGTIKGISQLLMMSKGGKAAQHAMMSKMISDSEKLSDVKFKKVNDNGNEVIEMSLPDGSKRRVSSPEQAVQTCEALMQMEFIVNNLKQETDAKIESEPENEVKPETEVKIETAPETIEEVKPETEVKVETAPETIEEVKPETEVKVETAPETVEEVKPETEVKVGQEKETGVELNPAGISKQFQIQKATEADLREIQQIDMEAFAGRYDILSDFEAYKADLSEQGVETFAIKGKDGSVVGYYQLEPVENRELYIHSLGVKKELRGTKSSYKALKQIQAEITRFAQEQNLDKVCLDVDSSKPELVKLYKKFGFEITGQETKTEAGHQYTDYHMEADVKKVLGLEQKSETSDVKETESVIKSDEVTEAEKSEKAEEVKTEDVNQTSKEEPFYVPRPVEKDLVPVTLNGDNYAKFHGRLYEKEGRTFITLNERDYEVRFADINEMSKIVYANYLYEEAGFASEIQTIDINGRTGYIKEVPNKKTQYAIEKLARDYDINIYLDEMDIGQDVIRFNKNGREVRLEIVEENDPRLSGQNTTENTVYTTNSELLMTLDRFAGINETYIRAGYSVQCKFKDNKMPDYENIEEQMVRRHNVICEEFRRHNVKPVADMPVDSGIAQKISEMSFDRYNQERFDRLLTRDIEEEYKDYPTLKEDAKQKQSFYKSMVANNPEIKKYLAELERLVSYYGTDDMHKFLYTVDKTSHYRNISVERAAAYIEIARSTEKGNIEGKNFEGLQTIPDRFISRCVFEKGIKDINIIKEKWANNTQNKMRYIDFSSYPNMEVTVAQGIAKWCLDENGEISNYKVQMARIMLSMSPEFGKRYGSYFSHGPYSTTESVLRMCETKEQCVDVLENILPALKEHGIEYEDKETAKDIELLLKTLPADRPLLLEKLKFLRDNRVREDQYNSFLSNISTPEKFELYKQLKAEGFSNSAIDNIIKYSILYPFNNINMEMVEFLKSLQKMEDPDLDISLHQLIAGFSGEYKNAISNNDLQAKQAVIDKILRIKGILTNPARERLPLNLEQAIELLKLPADKYQQVYDALFIKDNNEFIIRVDGNNGCDFGRVVTLMQDDTYAQRFYEDYLPLAKKYPRRGLQYGYYLDCLLRGKEDTHGREVNADFKTTMSHLKYLLETSSYYNESSLIDAALLGDKEFKRLITDLKPIKILGDKQPYEFYLNEIANLSDMDYMTFKYQIMPKLDKLFPDGTVNEGFNNVYNNYLKLSSSQLDKIADTVGFFSKNYKELKLQSEEVTLNSVVELIHNKYKTILDIIDVAGQETLNHAIGLKIKGFKAFLENSKVLEKLDPECRTALKEQLATLPHPEQKLDKLSVIISLVEKVDNSTLLNIIRKIKSPEVTTVQQELADRIFADKNTPYETQIENFIQEFNVPESKQDIIRKFLRQQNLQDKYTTPPPLEKQLEILDKKINSINANDKIPEGKKKAILNDLHKQKQNLIANPENYTKPRLNEGAMKALSAQIEAHINLPKINRAFNETINREIYKMYGVEITDNLLRDIEYDNKYFGKLFNTDTKFKPQFVKLLELLKVNPGKPLSEIAETLPTNQQTRRLFEENGLDYDKWITFDENSRLRFTLEVDTQKALEVAKANLKTELSSELAQKLDPHEIAQISKIIEDMNIDSASKKDLPKIIKAIETHMENSEYWKQNNNDIKTFKDHINIHKKNIRDLESLKDTTEEMFVRLWDNDDIGRNLFFGNHVGCCTSIGGYGNSFAAPQHLMNSFVRGIEIVDKAGNSMGNSMCYFAKVDGQLTFVIDSFEANGKLGASADVTNAIIDYAKQVCAQMGQPDANVMFGPNYNKINKDRFVKTENHIVEVIGRVPDETYIDAIGGRADVNSPQSNRAMLEIIDL